MSSHPNDFDDDDSCYYEDDDSGVADGDLVDSLHCAECSRNFEVPFGENPDTCPLCGARFYD
jgi:rubrerythrin